MHVKYAQKQRVWIRSRGVGRYWCVWVLRSPPSCFYAVLWVRVIHIVHPKYIHCTFKMWQYIHTYDSLPLSRYITIYNIYLYSVSTVYCVGVPCTLLECIQIKHGPFSMWEKWRTWKVTLPTKEIVIHRDDIIKEGFLVKQCEPRSWCCSVAGFVFQKQP